MFVNQRRNISSMVRTQKTKLWEMAFTIARFCVPQSARHTFSITHNLQPRGAVTLMACRFLPCLWTAVQQLRWPISLLFPSTNTGMGSGMTEPKLEGFGRGPSHGSKFPFTMAAYHPHPYAPNVCVCAVRNLFTSFI